MTIYCTSTVQLQYEEAPPCTRFIMSRQLKRILIRIFLFQLSLLLLLYVVSSGYQNSNMPPQSLFKLSKSYWLGRQNSSPNREPLILILNKWAGSYSWRYKWVSSTQTTVLYLPSCPHSCRFTVDRDRDADKADMVIVNTFYDRDLPANLSRESILKYQETLGQIWTGITVESPYVHREHGKTVDDVFHWIATYRRDADIFWPYWSPIQRKDPLRMTPQKTKSKEKKLAAWLVSHCSTHSKRELLVETLQRYIPVDIYGECGKPCPKGRDCRAYIAANYKFYLAFENSLCVDYVTEKLFEMLRQSEPIVPVTYSWINDTTLTPPNSYIDASDFQSIKALAHYLKYLDSNEDEYNGYLQWRNAYEIVRNSDDTKLCKACEMLLKYKEKLADGGERMERQPSMLKRLNSLGLGGNFSYFKVAGNLVGMETVCFNPVENGTSHNWLLGS